MNVTVREATRERDEAAMKGHEHCGKIMSTRQ